MLNERLGNGEDRQRVSALAATEVTSISGRGVGMDVVRANIERIGGAIAIESRPNQGTTFTIKIPLKAGITPTSIFGCSTDRLPTLEKIVGF